MKHHLFSITLFFFCCFIGFGCSPQLRPIHMEKPHIYAVGDTTDSLVQKYAPLFLIHEDSVAHNRIGTPEAVINKKGDTRIHINPDIPSVYFEMRRFKTQSGNYTNLIYRIHFQKVPFRLYPFYLTAGKNTGILTIITLDEKNAPVLITTVGTCGCYAAIIPTTFLSENAFPNEWDKKHPLEKYGEVLPSLIDYTESRNPGLLITIRPDVHRVMGISIIDTDNIGKPGMSIKIHTPLKPIQNLTVLPAGGSTVSFYHQSGFMQGFVKGASKPWETLIMSWISLDPFVGTDKIYGSQDQNENPFYTSLKPWNREASNMNSFENFLRFWGWKL